MQQNAALQRLHSAWCASQVRISDSYVSSRISNSLNCSLIFHPQSGSNQGSNSDQEDQGNSRKGGKNARLRRIITGSEVILTPESVDALQNIAAAAPAEPISDGNLDPYFSNGDIGSLEDFALIGSPVPRPLLAGGIPPGTDPWFLGGLDPFNSLPHTDGEPIPKKSLICYCKKIFSSAGHLLKLKSFNVK
jgi:hypothetical protein